jgi:hypothetical protein
MNVLDRLAGEAKLKDLPIVNQEQQQQQPEVKIDSTEQEEVIKQPSEEPKEESSPVFKPFLNRIGQLIINPVGRSKEFFNKHHQQLYTDFVKPISSEINPTSSLTNEEIVNNRSIPLGRGHRLNTESSILARPQSIPVSNAAVFHHSEEHSPFQTLSNPQQTSMDSNVTTPSEIGPNKMTEKETKITHEEQQEEEDEIFEVINKCIEFNLSQIFDERIFSYDFRSLSSWEKIR